MNAYLANDFVWIVLIHDSWFTIQRHEKLLTYKSSLYLWHFEMIRQTKKNSSSFA